MRSLRRWVTQPVTIDASVPEAEPEGIGRARGPLLGGAVIFLRRGSCRAKQCRHHCDTGTSGFRNHVRSLLSWILGFVPKQAFVRSRDFRDLPRSPKA